MMAKNAVFTPEPPAHLSDAAATWFRALIERYESWADHEVVLLGLAAEAWDRCQEARQVIAEHGTTFNDRFGRPHARPQVKIENDSALRFARLLAAIGIPAQEPAADVRVPAIARRDGGA